MEMYVRVIIGFGIIVLTILLLLILTKIYLKLSNKLCDSSVCLTGKTVIVTGANAGLGYETALNLAMRGAKVILGCRNQERAVEAQKKIIAASENINVIVRLVNMSSFSSVRNFAQEIIKTEQRLDILINNAGAGNIPNSRTLDDRQTMIQINYYSPTLLTLLLLDLLKKTGKSRIVNVSSRLAALTSKLDVNDPDKYPLKSSLIVYSNSKLCNILFTKELAARLKNTSVTTYSLHPGVVYTEFFTTMPFLAKQFFSFFIRILCKNSKEGAQTTIYCAVEKGIEKFSGEHFHECARISPYWSTYFYDSKKLWEKTLEIINCPSQEYC